jgi:hypothetical protein
MLKERTRNKLPQVLSEKLREESAGIKRIASQTGRIVGCPVGVLALMRKR